MSTSVTDAIDDLSDALKDLSQQVTWLARVALLGKRVALPRNQGTGTVIRPDDIWENKVIVARDNGEETSVDVFRLTPLHPLP